jgi:hypothetical protein
MQTAFFLALGLAASEVFAFGQIQIDAQANVILPDGRRNLVVFNHTTKTITAWACQYTSRVGLGPEVVDDGFHDSVLFGNQKPIGPGAQATVAVGPLSLDEPVFVRSVVFHAAVFADGSTFGDPVWAARIQRRRMSAMEALDAELATLIALAPRATGGAITREALVGQLRSEMIERRDRESDQDLRGLIEALHSTVAANLAAVDKPFGESIDRAKSEIRGRRARMANAAAPAGSSAQ